MGRCGRGGAPRLPLDGALGPGERGTFIHPAKRLAGDRYDGRSEGCRWQCTVACSYRYRNGVGGLSGRLARFMRVDRGVHRAEFPLQRRVVFGLSDACRPLGWEL